MKRSKEQLEAIRECQVLFICSSQEKELQAIVDVVKDHPVLTVGETGGFLESGGVGIFIPAEYHTISYVLLGRHQL